MKVGDVVWVVTRARIPYQATITGAEGEYFQIDDMGSVLKVQCFDNAKSACTQYSWLCHKKAWELKREQEEWLKKSEIYAKKAASSPAPTLPS